MSITFTQNGKGRIVAHGVDFNTLVNRMAAAFDLTKDDAANHAATFLGARNHHEVIQRAKSPDVRSWDWALIEAHLSKSSISHGEEFPKTLPASQNLSWQRQGMALLKEAGALVKSDSLDIIALVGASKSGKTVLGANYTKAKKGIVVDVTTFSVFDRFEATSPVVFLDRPAALSVRPISRPQMPPLAWDGLQPNERTLEKAKEIFARHVPGMPWDDVASHFGVGGETPARAMARRVVLVVAFPTIEAVQDAIDSGLLLKMGGDWRKSAPSNWRAAHVVDLDRMKLLTLLGAGGRMYDGSFEPPRG